jgi:FHS family L-fucose permease-like MFS transporter
VKPYAAIGVVLVAIFVLIAVFVRTKGQSASSENNGISRRFGPTLGRLLKNKSYRLGVIAQFFYVGAQITCWTFIIQYGTHVFMGEGMEEQAAEILSQRLNIVAMVLFCCSRFICTALMKKFKPASMLAVFAAAAIILTAVVIGVGGRLGVYALVAVSACMSLMFPTIYGLALKDVGPDAEIGSAGLIMAILGGSLLPPVQAMIMDGGHINLSFIVPLICFVVVMAYGLRCRNLHIR